MFDCYVCSTMRVVRKICISLLFAYLLSLSSVNYCSKRYRVIAIYGPQETTRPYEQFWDEYDREHRNLIVIFIRYILKYFQDRFSFCYVAYT